ncbi:MAG TPA: biotin--[acetyl-CoA-carboxylase] ligase [Candidatus Acidoferrales bacterium]|nr:biotin--[acetyl-CoA-carboxylase] ligase [Candidatus Acidoferrales bacterium]
MPADLDILSEAAIRAGVAAGTLGRVIRCLERVDSTNLYARRLAEEEGPEGVVVLAEEQTQGRGRLGRTWFSPPHANLYFSVLLRPPFPAGRAPQITLMAAVALAETLHPLLGDAPEIKWPNDIVVRGKKLAGILTESACAADRIKFAILGIGINVNLTPGALPEPLRARATSLRELSGVPWDRNKLAALLIQGLDRCYKELTQRGFGEMAARWERYFALKDRRVEVRMTDEVLRGVAAGIDADGALLVRERSGTLRRVLAGDVFPASADRCS